jgi:DnaJ-class molecular chaperone
MGDEYCRRCKSKLATCPTCKGKGTTYSREHMERLFR